MLDLGSLARFTSVSALAALLTTAISLALAGCGGRSSSASGETQWGEPVRGLQAGLALKSIKAGPEPRIALVFSVRNAGDKPVRILKLTTGFTFHGVNLPLEVASRGERCKYQGPLLEPPPAPFAGEFIDLQPGEVDSIEQEMRPELWGLKPSFNAKVHFVFQWAGTSCPTRDGKTATGLWTGEARSKPVDVKVDK